MLVEKEVIAPGTYWYEDPRTGLPRKWVVSAETTKYLHEQGNAMLAQGLPVPVPCEHDFNAHPMTPADRLKNNAGWVKDYRLKGDVLFSVVDVQDEELAKKLPKTIRWTSPWISSFTDGAGKQWNNVIAHLALTTRPRVTKQAPFGGVAAAMAFALNAPADAPDLTKPGNAKGITLSKAGRLIEKDGKLRPEFPIAFSLYAGGIRLSEDDMPPTKKKKGDEDGNSPSADATDDMPTGDDPPGGGSDLMDMNPLADQAGDVKMEELLCDLLSALGVMMPENVGEAQFKRALYEATMSKIKELTGKANMPDMPDQNANPTTGAQNNPLIQQEQQPMYMSLEEINKIEDPALKSIALSMHAENTKLRAALDANEKATASLRDAKLKEENAKRSLRISRIVRMAPSTKTNIEAMLALPSMALSMGDGGTVVDPMTQTLEILEKGLADMPRLLTTDSKALSEMPQPTDADALSNERADEIAEGLARKMGAPAEVKK